jgi:hypothetical protein
MAQEPCRPWAEEDACSLVVLPGGVPEKTCADVSRATQWGHKGGFE